MRTSKMNAKQLQSAFLAGAKRIEAKKEFINELNVFPVPDGDTGTNMSLTIMSAAKEVQMITEPTMSALAKAISSGSLRGARGNSGVILSQLFRGFCRSVGDKEELSVTDISMGFNKAVETAYKAVMKPKEGTILTVAKGIADMSVELSSSADDLGEFFKRLIDYGYEILAKTPDMLPVLKEAGVVDSGGQGLMEVLHGAYDAFVGNPADFDVEIPVSAAPQAGRTVSTENIDTSHIKFGYCTEFIIMLEKPFGEKDEEELKEFLLSIGDSLVVVADDEIVKIHVHTNHPGQAFEKGLTYGSLSNMKVDNMRIEHQEKVIKESEKLAAIQMEERTQHTAEPAKPYGFIAVSIGEGMNDIFGELNVDYIISGGQTMNPSTEDMLEAIKTINAENIFILPNNKNIILAANQAQSLTEDKNVIVIPSKTIPQGISAMIAFSADASLEENEESMKEALCGVRSGEVTYAVRDTSIEGREIHMGDYMGIGDNGIEAVGKNLEETAALLIQAITDEDSELVSLYYGEEVSEAAANALAEKVAAENPDADVEVYYGGQPIYYYVVSVE